MIIPGFPIPSPRVPPSQPRAAGLPAAAKPADLGLEPGGTEVLPEAGGARREGWQRGADSSRRRNTWTASPLASVGRGGRRVAGGRGCPSVQTPRVVATFPDGYTAEFAPGPSGMAASLRPPGPAVLGSKPHSVLGFFSSAPLQYPRP